VRDIRIEYTKKLGRQEALIKNCLNRQGYTIFEYTGGGGCKRRSARERVTWERQYHKQNERRGE
jgi:hypothetical protein